jgi:hypothetical protein
MFSLSTGAVRAKDSFCNFWKQFPWWFLSGQGLSFPWHFLSQQVLCALRIPSVISGNSFRDDFSVVRDSVFLDIFWVNRCCALWGFLLSSLERVFMMISDGQRLSFPWCFICQQVLCALRIPSVISGNSFRDDFSVDSDPVFLNILWVNRCCARWGVLLSSL